MPYAAYSRRKQPVAAGRIRLDLDPNAHSRTDPVSALGALLKLLSSLPSRIGGCQYKLTPAEHNLSLHLISIVDPFVCYGARALTLTTNSTHENTSFSSLVDQPTEILDGILSHVDSRKDLLNIGLVCKRLHDVVFPRHFDYRVIRCKLSSIAVWNHLTVHKSLARNVRKLEILDERSPISNSVLGNSHHSSVLIPRISLRDTDLENTEDELGMHPKQTKFFAAALVHMTGLKEFKWSCNHSPISIAHVWPTLMMRTTNLTNLEISDNLLFGSRFFSGGTGESTDSSDDEAEQSSCSVPLTTYLPSGSLAITNVVLRSTSHTFGVAKQPDLNRVSRMLQKCRQLESVEITYNPPRTPGHVGGQVTMSRIRPLADEFFVSSRWSSTLTTLILNNIRCSTPTTSLVFLSEHPALEVLHLDISLHIGGFSGRDRLPQGSLPNLREIKSSKEFINAVLECSCDAPRPLQSLKGFKLSGHAANHVTTSSRSISDSAFLSNLKVKAPAVDRIELSGWYDMEDIRKLVPSISNVQHLSLGKRIGAVNRRELEKTTGGISGPSHNTTEWIDLLSALPDLTSLHGVKFFYEVPTESTRPSDHSGIVNGSSNIPKPHAVAQLSQMSMMERSRIRKNDEVAGVLAWKCTKLRWVDHWEEGIGKVIHLVRDGCESPGEDGKPKVRWEVKRTKAKC